MGFARESGPATDPPKEQPPRNLSGTPDRAGLIGTLESGRAFEARLTEGVTPGHRRKALRFRDRGGDANGNRITGRSVVFPGDRRPE
jgi:hypothetical protein